MKLEPLSEKRFKRHLLLFSLTMTLLVVVGSTVYFQYEKRLTFENKSRAMSVIAGMKAEQLVQWNKERLSEVSFFSTSEPQLRYVYPLLSGDLSVETALRKSLLHIMSDKRYENILLLRTDARLVFSVNPSLCQIDKQTVADVQTVNKTKTIVHREFYTCTNHGKVRNYYLAPVMRPDSIVLGVLLFQLNPEDFFYPLLTTWPQPTKTGETLLMRRSGDHVEYLSPLREQVDTATLAHPDQVKEGHVAWQILQGEEGIFEGRDYRGVNVLADIRRITDTDWYLITKTDKAELYEQLHKIQVFVSMISAFLLMLLWVSLAWLYKVRQQKMYKELVAKNLALKRSQEEFAATLYSIGDGVITTDDRGHLVRLNSAAEKMTGWLEKEAIGLPIETIFTLVNEETNAPEPNPVRLILVDDPPQRVSHAALLVTKKGKQCPITLNCAPIYMSRGNKLGAVLVFRDHSEESGRHRLIETRLHLLECAVNNNLQDAMNQMVKEIGRFTQSSACFFLAFANDNRLVTLQACDSTDNSSNLHEPECLSVKAKLIWSVCVDTAKPYLYFKPANSDIYPYDHPLAFIEQALVVPVLRQGMVVAVLGVVNKPNGYEPEDLDFVSYLADVVWEVTEAKVNYDNLQASEHKYRALIDNMNDTVWIIDLNGRLLDVNMAALTQLGYTKEEILSLGLMGIDASHTNDEINEMADDMHRDITQVFETIHRAKDGRLIPVEVSSSLIDYKGGKAIVSIARDITSRRRDEGFRHLLYEIASFSLTTHTLEDLMQVIRTELNEVMDAARLRLLLFDQETGQLQPITFSQASAPNMDDSFDNYLAQCVFTSEASLLLTGDDWASFLQTHHLAATTPYPLSWLAVPLNDGQTCLGVLSMQHETDAHAYDKYNLKVLEMVGHELSVFLHRQKMIQDLIQARDKAEESDRLKTAFLANVSHEIRTPMNGILGFMEMLGDPDLDDAQRESYLGIVNKSGRRLLATINDIVEISKIEAGLITLHSSPMNLADMMNYQLAFFKKEAEEKSLTLTLEASLDGAEALVIIDRNKLEGILSNLLNNALKFTHTGGVVFGNSLKDDQLLFYVRDTGIGIESSKLDLIFQRFAQADLSSTRPYEGAGLGLSIVKAYVEKMGGRIWVESTVGVGSTFYVQLPYYPVDTQPVKEVEAMPLLDETIPVTILVAEDDETSYQYLEIILSLEGAIVLRATNGGDAVKVVKDHPEVDLVLMDVKMPGLNGLEATRLIRAFNTTIPIIAQTAYAFDKDKVEAMDAGCTDFLAKPVKRQALLALIRQYVKRSPAK